MRRIVSMVLLSCLIVGVTSCETDETFPTCVMDPCLYEQCSEQAEDVGSAVTAYSCKVLHPQCDDGICLVWQGSGPFCTMSCQSDADCPEGATCLELLKDDAYCVPPESDRPGDPPDPGDCTSL